MISWPKELINAIEKRKSVLFLGAGISANSKNKDGKSPATWNMFLQNIITCKKEKMQPYLDELNELLNKEDYLTACEIIVDIIGEQEFGELAADEFRRPGYCTNKIHEAIYSLDSRLVLTPNIDKLYEQYATNASHSTIVVKSYYDEDIAKYLRTEDFLIIRIHGYVDDASKIVFTHKQYGKARCLYASFYQLLDALILTHTFIFLGCGINDPDIKLLLENSNFMYPNCRPHYFITSQNTYSPGTINCLLKNRNIEILEYPNPDGTHKELLNELNSLNKEVEARRNEIANSCTW